MSFIYGFLTGLVAGPFLFELGKFAYRKLQALVAK
jgi:hypothetical protein